MVWRILAVRCCWIVARVGRLCEQTCQLAAHAVLLLGGVMRTVSTALHEVADKDLCHQARP